MKFLVSELLAPAARRLGTAAGASLVAYGAAKGLADQVEAVVTGVALFGVDLMWSHFARKGR